MSIYSQDKLQYVMESVESILNQTYYNFHYFLIFDGPVQMEVEQYITALTDDRIRLSKLEKNCGLALALNALLKVVLKNPEYKYIARMDADDISLKERFEKQRHYLINNPVTTILGTWYEEIDEFNKVLRIRRLPVEHNLLRKRYLVMTPCAHSSVMFKRRLFEVCGVYPTDTYLMEDNYLWGKAFAHQIKFANLPEILFKFRVDQNFYKRRSGFVYGLNYVRTKFKIIKELRLPIFCYIISLFIGISRMMPFLFSNQ